ncbi:DUF262 domain-containing protein [Bisbaumannia pacifica]|uniref:DUF262 domain-containing protein n=1 Tax=Bisbaumannia pacifica TaxID=77098 RepID=A0ABD4L685_9GAMM|nr:DUF262 domain-containing protein [Halomonas pacifica]MBH8581094.1 DUF262 domain-containing protein [Halomonas pacifica]
MNLDGSSKKVGEVFSGSYKYKVPENQRRYEWTIKDEVSEFWQDIINNFSDGKREYFIGPVVLTRPDDAPSSSEKLVIDGQQRLTTITILFCVLRNFAKKYGDIGNSGIFSSFVDSHDGHYADELLNGAADIIRASGFGKNYRFESNEIDQPVLHKDVLEWYDIDPFSRVKKPDPKIVKTRKFFEGKIYKSFVDGAAGLDKLLAFAKYVVEELKFIVIEAGSESDAYMLFESLNSRGLGLTAADLLKNRFLMVSSKSSSSDKDYVKNKWNDIVSLVSGTRFSTTAFFRFYYWAENGKVSQQLLYKSFSDQIIPGNVTQKISEIEKAAEFFSRISDKELKYPLEKFKASALEKIGAELNTLGYKSPYPLLIAVKLHRENILTEVAAKTRDFLFRYVTILDESPSDAESRLDEVRRMVVDKTVPDQDVLEKLDCIKPADEDFKEALIASPFSKSTVDVVRYILCRIYEKDYGFSTSINPGRINVEHVLPQETSKWSGFSFEGFSEENVIWSIGNMIILEEPLNKSLKNNEFSKKVISLSPKNPENGEGTEIQANHDIYHQYIRLGRVWDVEWIRERAKSIAEKCVGIW